MLNGIDIASHQAGINAGTIAGEFVIIKATGGTQYVNPYCDTFYQSAKKAGKLLGIYHYAYEAYCPGTPEQEAEHFLKNVQGYIGEAVLILDFEAENKTDVNWAKRWLDYVYQKTGIKPMFYTYTAVLNAADFSPIANADYALWLANYGTNHVQGYNKPNTPAGRGFPSVAMHQYTSSGRLDGWSGNLDLNIFYGDANAWKAYAGNKSIAPTVTAPVKKSNEEIASEVIEGLWGTGQARIDVLNKAGYDVAVIQNLVNQKLDVSTKKSDDAIAGEVIAGKWSSGQDRINKLMTAGYNATTIQNLVNQKLKGTEYKKTNQQIANEIFLGQGGWGDDPQRTQKLKAAGYDSNAIQSLLNKMF